jgi:hypothetical protein
MPPALFALIILEIFLSNPAQTLMLLVYVFCHPWDDKRHRAQIFSIEMRSYKFFLPGLAWNHNPPDFSFSSSQDYRHEPPHPASYFSSPSPLS